MTSASSLHAELGGLVVRVARRWRREVDHALSAHGLSQATALPLLILSRRESDIRQGALAEETGIEGPSLVRLVDRLEAEGLVERREDPTDRRAKTLRLTDYGRAKAADINIVVQGVRRRLLGGIPDEHLALVLDVLRLIEQRTETAQEDSRAPAA